MIDFSIFTTAEAWISLITLMFLEIVLGVDNIVFISITSNRLAPEKRHLGRKLGLAGAMIMRILFLSVASLLVHMVDTLFTIDLGFWSHGFSVRDLILFAGGIYLIYKGISELYHVLNLTEQREADRRSDIGKHLQSSRRISLPQAVGTIMIMDIVFSIDSVITAVGLAQHLIIMILAVIIAVIIMMVFIDVIADFINRHTEMMVLALVFITTIGILLFLDSLGINSGIEVLDMHMEKLMVYFAMVFSVVIVGLLIAYRTNVEKYEQELAASKEAAAGKAASDAAAVAEDQLSEQKRE